MQQSHKHIFNFPVFVNVFKFHAVSYEEPEEVPFRHRKYFSPQYSFVQASDNSIINVAFVVTGFQNVWS